MKMYCVFSKEAIKAMNGNRGKFASMAGHAFLHAYWDASDKCWNDRYHKNAAWPALYRHSGFAKKVTVFVETTEELIALYEQVKDQFVGSSLVVDKGLTVFNGPTTVCFGYGPVPDEFVPQEIANLKVLI